MSFTTAQQSAIDSRQNTIVVAGAGAGKTRTLVERCVQRLLDPADPVSIDQMLVVTFTEAAAAEMRHRIQERLEKELDFQPHDERLLQQIALLDSASISTLHSFCWRLVREHFYELDLDPVATVMQEQQSKILFAETLDDLLREHYEALHANSKAVQQYILEKENGRDYALRKLLSSIHDFTQSRPDPAGWFTRQRQILSQPSPSHWRSWLLESVHQLCHWYLPLLRGLPAENTNAQACVQLLEKACRNPSLEALDEIIRRKTNCWVRGKTKEHRAGFLKFFDHFEALAEFAKDPALQEDWDWSRDSLQVVLTLSEQFEQRYAAAKRERGLVDFHDLEQLALQLLWDPIARQPTVTAREWQQRFKLVFIDEYQDINQAQDLILRAVSRPENGGNRFLVGDIKQSIYRFRQADPSIFRAYIEQKNPEPFFLSENFRSHQAILEFLNPFFAWLMQKDLGGIVYDEEARLKFGNRPTGEHMSAPVPTPAQVEVHLILKDGEPAPDEEDSEDSPEAPAADIEDAEREAALIARRLHELHSTHYQIYDEKEQRHRKAEFSDMVVLLRAPAGKAESYARAFDKAGVPLQVKRNVFYSAPEVADLVNLLTILDNPLQDIPFIAVLRSPLAGLTANELALIRLANRKDPFALAVNRFLEIKEQDQAVFKLQVFMDRFHRWRKEGLNSSLSQRLESILAETHYDDWIKAQPRGGQRYANIQQLIQIARQFDELKGEGLYQFVRHVQELQDEIGDIEPAPLEATNAVRLMSVHQSKGLEFPIVVVADMGKKVDFREAQSGTVLHEKFGLCAKIKPPGRFRTYNSLPLVLARREEKIATTAEEIRLLYVALTRAKNLLICTGSASEKTLEHWTENRLANPHPEHLIQNATWLNWLASFLQLEQENWHSESNGAGEWWNWRVHPRQSETEQKKAARTAGSPALTPEQAAALRERFSWEYSFEAATRQHAKTTVTQLRRSLADTFDDESALAPFIRRSASPQGGAERGLAHHHFLQHLDLLGPLDRVGLEAQARALAEAHVLTPEELELLNFDNLAAFWASDVGRDILDHRSQMQRELPFTFRVTNEELAQLPPRILENLNDGEFVIVQGIADLVIMLEREIWLLDFKTDGIDAASVPAAATLYRPQIELYAAALQAIYNKPVTRKWFHFFAPGRTIPI